MRTATREHGPRRRSAFEQQGSVFRHLLRPRLKTLPASKVAVTVVHRAPGGYSHEKASALLVVAPAKGMFAQAIQQRAVTAGARYGSDAAAVNIATSTIEMAGTDSSHALDTAKSNGTRTGTSIEDTPPPLDTASLTATGATSNFTDMGIRASLGRTSSSPRKGSGLTHCAFLLRAAEGRQGWPHVLAACRYRAENPHGNMHHKDVSKTCIEVGVLEK